jgi:hypothetical protein
MRVISAVLMGNRDKNFDKAMNAVDSSVKRRLDPAVATREAPVK